MSRGMYGKLDDRLSRGMYGKLDDRWLRIENISNFLDEENLNAESI